MFKHVTRRLHPGKYILCYISYFASVFKKKVGYKYHTSSGIVYLMYLFTHLAYQTVFRPKKIIRVFRYIKDE